MPPVADAPQSAGLSGALAAPLAAPATARRTLALWSDDGATARLWCERLGQEGLHVRALPPRCDLAHLVDAPADALMLVTLQGMSEQLQRVRELRGLAPWTPLLVACRTLRDLDQVLALELGADDVLDAAWSGAVVAARLRALWRRVGRAGSPSAEGLRFGSLAIHARERQVTLAGCPVPLTEGEFEVLWLLASHADTALSRRDILRQVRGIDESPLDRSIDSRVYRIRAKLGDANRSAQRIRTVRHRGYVFCSVGW